MSLSRCLDEVAWIKAVIESCETPRQIHTCNKLVYLLIKKWDDVLADNNLEYTIDWDLHHLCDYQLDLIIEGEAENENTTTST